MEMLKKQAEETKEANFLLSMATGNAESDFKKADDENAAIEVTNDALRDERRARLTRHVQHLRQKEDAMVQLRNERADLDNQIVAKKLEKRAAEENSDKLKEQELVTKEKINSLTNNILRDVEEIESDVTVKEKEIIAVIECCNEQTATTIDAVVAEIDHLRSELKEKEEERAQRQSEHEARVKALETKLLQERNEHQAMLVAIQEAIPKRGLKRFLLRKSRLHTTCRRILNKVGY